jgi:hypothetical protein
MSIRKRTQTQRLQFQERDKIQITCDTEQQKLMREIWLWKRHSQRNKQYLGDYYADAFAEYLIKHRVPKTVPKITRQKTRVHLSPSAKTDLESLGKIARKRKQSKSVIIEEAIQEYLDKPENFLGSQEYTPQKTERIV